MQEFEGVTIYEGIEIEAVKMVQSLIESKGQGDGLGGIDGNQMGCSENLIQGYYFIERHSASLVAIGGGRLKDP